MVEVALVFQLAHDPAHGGRRHAQAIPAGDGLAAGRLSGLHVEVDHRLEDAEFAFAEGSGCRHDWEI